MEQPGTINPADSWTNEPTWFVRCYLGQDEQAMAFVLSVLRRSDDPDKIGKALSDFVEEHVYMMVPSSPKLELQQNLIGAALEQVNWREIAEHFMTAF